VISCLIGCGFTGKLIMSFRCVTSGSPGPSRPDCYTTVHALRCGRALPERFSETLKSQPPEPFSKAMPWHRDIREECPGTLSNSEFPRGTWASFAGCSALLSLAQNVPRRCLFSNFEACDRSEPRHDARSRNSKLWMPWAWASILQN
jgi:hypothetical protein